MLSAPQDLHDLMALVAPHRSDLSGSGRAGTVIRKFRPAYRLDGGFLTYAGSPVVEPPRDFDLPALSRLAAIAEQWAAGVGRIEVEGPGGFVPAGTAFRVAGGPARMVTNRHVPSAMLPEGESVDLSYPAAFSGPLRNGRVVFDLDEPAAAHPIGNCVWSHPKWDLLIFDLHVPNIAAFELERPALPLETDRHWGAAELNPVCVIGFPTEVRHETSLALRSAFAASEADLDLEAKHVSLGLATCRQDLPAAIPLDESQPFRWAGRHDASTLAGSSGSPVFSLATGKVIGVHARAGTYEGDESHALVDMAEGNHYVDLPLALTEPHLRFEMTGGTRPADGERLAWDPPVFVVHGLSDVRLEGTGEVAYVPVRASPIFAEVRADRPDFRDTLYEPPLALARDRLLPEDGALPETLNQLGEPACVGFAVATAIHIQLRRLGREDQRVSTRMLYESARLYDEFLDDGAGGTSLRGSIKGFYHAGVCPEDLAPYRPGESGWSLSIKAAKAAQAITLGAYRRLRPDVLHVQLALAETGAVVVSAHVHEGWLRTSDPVGCIPFSADQPRIGTHAFVIVGYDEDGFLVLNSWGRDWSSWQDRPGLAHWSYEDWGENLIDAWVLQLAPSTPKAFGLVPRIAHDHGRDGDPDAPASPLAHLPRPRRQGLLGHVFQTEHDGIVARGRLGMGIASLRETALHLGDSVDKYPHVLIVCHDPLMGADTLARLCGALIEPFKACGVYPIHLIHGLDETLTIALRLRSEADACARAVQGSGQRIDAYLEDRARRTCGRILRAFAIGADEAARSGGPLWRFLASLGLEAPANQRYHLMAIGIGAFVADALCTVTAPPVTLPKFRSLHDVAALRTRSSQPPDVRVGTRHLLSSLRMPSLELASYRGDWIDLCHAALDTAGPVRPRSGSVDKGPQQTTLAALAADPTLREEIIAAITAKPPRKHKAVRADQA